MATGWLALASSVLLLPVPSVSVAAISSRPQACDVLSGDCLPVGSGECGVSGRLPTLLSRDELPDSPCSRLVRLLPRRGGLSCAPLSSIGDERLEHGARAEVRFLLHIHTRIPKQTLCQTDRRAALAEVERPRGGGGGGRLANAAGVAPILMRLTMLSSTWYHCRIS